MHSASACGGFKGCFYQLFPSCYIWDVVRTSQSLIKYPPCVKMIIWRTWDSCWCVRFAGIEAYCSYRSVACTTEKTNGSCSPVSLPDAGNHRVRSHFLPVLRSPVYHTSRSDGKRYITSYFLPWSLTAFIRTGDWIKRARFRRRICILATWRKVWICSVPTMCLDNAG